MPRCVARGLARLHTVPMESKSKEEGGVLWPRLLQFIRLVPDSFPDPSKQVETFLRVAFNLNKSQITKL